MKKYYSNPKFKLVTLDSNDIVCASPLGDNQAGYGGDGTGKSMSSKQRGGIWGDDED